MEVTRNAIDDIAAALDRLNTDAANRWRALCPTRTVSRQGDWQYANGMLRIQLGRVSGQDTRDLREILNVGEDYDRWLQQVELFIIPFMVNNGLPQ